MRRRWTRRRSTRPRRMRPRPTRRRSTRPHRCPRWISPPSPTPKLDAQVPKNLVPGQTPEAGADAPDKKQPPAADAAKEPGADPSDPSAVSKAAQRIATAKPETLTAPEQDVQLAKQSKPIEVKPEPASKQDVDFLSSAINLQSKTKLGPFESEFGAGSEFSVGDRSATAGTASTGTRRFVSGIGTGSSTTSSTGRSSSIPSGLRCGSSMPSRTPRGFWSSSLWRGSSSTWPSSLRTASRLWCWAPRTWFLTWRTWRLTW